MNMEEIIDRLKAPFPFSETECKLQATNSDKTQGLAVFYIYSRAIQNRLDETVGPFNWRNEYMLWQDKAQICGISIYDDTRQTWVTKFDGAENTEYEPIKGGLSDSLKRAAVMWGLGRYLYDIDGLWVEIAQKGKSYFIKSSEKSKLESHYNKFIKGSSTQQAPSAGTGTATAASNQSQQADAVQYDYKIQSAAESGKSICMKLVGNDGKELTAYVKKDSEGIKTGALIKNVQMEKNQASFGTYYTIKQYEVAA
jgi:hypothetical protein